MSAPGALRPRRRSLAALLTASGGAVLLGGCGGPSPVPTSAQVARDPLAALDAAHWDARSAEELRALPLQGAAEELETWADLGAEDSAVDTAREQLTGFLGAAYLDPSALRGLSDQDALDHVSSATPEFWRDALHEAWGGGDRTFYALALAEPFRSVGRPAICADWFRTEGDGGPALALGTTIAWTAIDTSTRAVGVLACRLGIVVDLDAQGGLSAGTVRLTLHGLDGCAMGEHEGLLVPALADDDRHRAVQQATREQILDAPRTPLADLLDEDSALFAGDEETFLERE